ncbi:unnamed protein product [Linum trigynum]|uniref:RBR-type E3 ubiquitin transferase n=1 Tax=Linum trigynum TaxID=586398 RepID=A0AAV2FYC4_9ROSI
MDSADKDAVEAVLSEQRREILEAKTVSADLDFAFDLQMQEAITASMRHLPSSSSSSLSPPPPPPPSPPPSAPPAEPEFDYVSLLLDDIERLNQEWRDREASEYFLQEMKTDLDRRIFDQNFAGEILDIPADQWEKYGDNYEKPYGSGGGGGGGGESSSDASSSSKVAAELAWVSAETFRLYFKGLESEERVRDKKVTVAGFGVAICDSKDNLIFELSKRLDAATVSRSAGKISEGLLVGIHALIEGLNAALNFDLKKLTFLCDDFMAYQYLTGRVQPTQAEVLDLVTQVSSLQRKFTECTPALVGRNNIKFAFKLARDAIVSQITWPEETGNGGKSRKETCVICYEDTDTAQMFSVNGCLHRYCFGCMKQHVEVKLLNGKDAKCPHESCDSVIEILSCATFLDPKLVDMLSLRRKEAAIPVKDKIYCPYPKCSELMTKTEVLAYTKLSLVGAEVSGARKCMKCKKYFCINCKVPWHYDMTCADYKRSNHHPREDKMLNTLANKSKWRQCVKCSHMIELDHGCYHITCRCGYEFCYTCGAPWKNKRATCTCPIWDERNIIRR